MDGLQARSRSSIKRVLSRSDDATSNNSNGQQLDPNIRLCHLSPQKRAAIWRLLHTAAPVPGLAGMVAALASHYVRIKEVLESMETFRHVERIIKQRRRQQAVNNEITHIYDVGCGHGLVSMLCAATNPHIKVHAIDLVPRQSFQAQRKAFILAGTPMDNLTFEAGDLSILQDRDNISDGHHGLILCIHGCKSLTHESIELAKRNKWAWLALPCCLQLENHLNEKTSFKGVSDETRFAILCGAIAAKYQPDTVTTIDSRITARGILLASSGPESDKTI
jgi:SAM-dependent methyltransferase